MFRMSQKVAAWGRWLPLLCLVSCGSIQVSKDASTSEWLDQWSESQKKVAAATVAHEEVRGVPLKDYLMLRGAIVSDGAKPKSTNARGSVKVAVPPSGFGSAVSLGDGYFLTAAHVPADRGGWLVGWEAGPKAVVRRYRVVWSGDSEHCDLALLHADVDSPGLPMASPADLKKGQTVHSFGYGKGKPAAAAGRLIAVEPRRHHVEVLHSCPLEQGDSGGLLVTADGKLAGIQSRVDYGWVKLFGRAWVRARSRALLPDAGWIAEKIAADKQRR